MELLRHPHRDHPEPPFALGTLQQWADQVDLAALVFAAEAQQLDAVVLGEALHGGPEALANGGKERR